MIFENGLPKLSEIQGEEEIMKWDKEPLRIKLEKKSNVGEDTLILLFSITEKADLLLEYFDIYDNFIGEYKLGKIF